MRYTDGEPEIRWCCIMNIIIIISKLTFTTENVYEYVEIHN